MDGRQPIVADHPEAFVRNVLQQVLQEVVLGTFETAGLAGHGKIRDVSLLESKIMKCDEGSRVMGYFAATSTTVLCDGPACVIAGSKEAMGQYIRQVGKSTNHYTMRKTRFSEVLEGIFQGGEYAFDRIAWERLYPLLKSMA